MRFIVTATCTTIGNPKTHRIAEAQQNMREFQRKMDQENNTRQVLTDLQWSVNLRNANKR